MKIKITKQELETEAPNLLLISEEMSLPATGIAMAINNRMIPRTQWGEVAISDNDSIVIIKAACGG